MGGDGSSTEVDRWRDAAPLQTAWYSHAPEDLKRQYQDSGAAPEQRSIILQRMMEAEVASMIAGGEVIAYGVQVKPKIEEAPSQLRAILFETGDAKIDWVKGTVKGLGRRFASVRIFPASPVSRKRNAIRTAGAAGPVVPADAPDLPPVVKVRRPQKPSAPSQAIATQSAPVATHQHPAPPPSRPGPKSGDALIRKAYDALVASGRLPPTHTLKQAWAVSSPELALEHPDDFRGGRGLSYPTFSRILRPKPQG